MTVSEFAFLAMGLLLGVAAGAALIEVLRARPPAPREVRVTVAHDAIPNRRSTTLADDAFVSAAPEPARGGPADRRVVDAAGGPDGRDRRTPVRSGWTAATAPERIGTEGIGEGVRPRPSLTPAVVRSIPAGLGDRATASLVGVPVSGGDDPMLVALRASAAASAVAASRATEQATGPVAERPALSETAVAEADAAETAVAVLEAPPDTSSADAVESDGSTGSSTRTAGTAVEAGPCADARRVAEERCELATRARAGAAVAEETLRAAQRAYDEHEARAEQAAALADPRAVRAAKDAAQAAFRQGRDRAGTTEDVEGAARTWLAEINRINAEARDAGAAATREREAARSLALDLERLSLEADAARIGAETAEAACLAAREAAADCEEQASGMGAVEPRIPSGAPAGLFTDEPTTFGVLGEGGTPRIFRLLRGDRAALGELVAALAGDDQEARKRWQLALSDLVDAILADSIAASALTFPADHPFWGPFTLSQDRDIVSALSSLGYRFDGLGGWVDGRVPSQRDLSLALGYAGLDPMRIRHWPTEAEMQELFADVEVSADEHLASAAGDLTLGELVTMLGRRADGLAELWNEWGRLRPLLLEEG